MLRGSDMHTRRSCKAGVTATVYNVCDSSTPRRPGGFDLQQDIQRELCLEKDRASMRRA
jgi:hypothetical protein